MFFLTNCLTIHTLLLTFLLVFCLYRGVFQALIDKHFPVPNSYGKLVNDFPKMTNQVGKKRKGGNLGRNKGEKKFRKEDLFGHGGCEYKTIKDDCKLFFLEVQ